MGNPATPTRRGRSPNDGVFACKDIEYFRFLLLLLVLQLTLCLELFTWQTAVYIPRRAGLEAAMAHVGWPQRCRTAEANGHMCSCACAVRERVGFRGSAR